MLQCPAGFDPGYHNNYTECRLSEDNNPLPPFHFEWTESASLTIPHRAPISNFPYQL